jgi:hypothetical protein
MYAAAILFLILFWLFGRNVFKAIWWIIGPGILGIIGPAWFGSTLPDQPAPKLEDAAAVTPAPSATPALLEYGFDEK